MVARLSLYKLGWDEEISLAGIFGEKGNEFLEKLSQKFFNFRKHVLTTKC